MSSPLVVTNDTLIAELDKDYYAQRYNEPSSKVLDHIQWTYQQLIDHCDPEDVEHWSPKPTKVRWVLNDDDGETYYGGWLFDDDACLTQWLVLEWGKYDSGCTTIMVERDGKWVVDIG